MPDTEIPYFHFTHSYSRNYFKRSISYVKMKFFGDEDTSHVLGCDAV